MGEVSIWATLLGVAVFNIVQLFTNWLLIRRINRAENLLHNHIGGVRGS